MKKHSILPSTVRKIIKMQMFSCFFFCYSRERKNQLDTFRCEKLLRNILMLKSSIWILNYSKAPERWAESFSVSGDQFFIQPHNSRNGFGSIRNHICAYEKLMCLCIKPTASSPQLCSNPRH